MSIIVQLAGNGVALTDVLTPRSGPGPVGSEFKRKPDNPGPLSPAPRPELSLRPLKAPTLPVPIWPPPERKKPTTPAELPPVPPFTPSELKILAETPAGENPVAGVTGSEAANLDARWPVKALGIHDVRGTHVRRSVERKDEGFISWSGTVWPRLKRTAKGRGCQKNRANEKRRK